MLWTNHDCVNVNGYKWKEIKSWSAPEDMRPSFGPLTLDWPHRLNPVFDAAGKEVQVEKRLEFTQWSQISLSLSCCLFASVSLYSVMQCWPGQSDSGLWSIYSLVWSGPRWPDLSSEWVLTQSFTDLNIYDIISTSLRSTGKKTSGSRTTGGPCCLWIFQSYFQLCCFKVFTNSVSLYYFLKNQ